MSFLQPMMLWALPLVALPIVIHLINQRRYQTRQWGAMMFLLAANRMNRGYARLRQWMILAMRALAIAGLVFLISRPLASSLLGLTAGSQVDTTLILLDRSPSMQQQGNAGQAKLSTGKRQLLQTLRTLGSAQWVLIDSDTDQPQAFPSLDALVDSPGMSGSSATADIPQMLQAAADYLTANKSGATDIWICSDLRSADWKPESANWTAVRQTLQKFPQALKIHLLAYADEPENNLTVRVSDAHRESFPAGEAGAAGEAVVLNVQVTQAGGEHGTATKRTIPVQIEIDGARSELNVEMTGRDVEIRNHRVPVTGQKKNIGKVSIPADQNNADNEFYFVCDEARARRVVLVSDDRQATRALELAASISPNGQTEAEFEAIAPEQLDSSTLENTSLLIWQTSLPVGPLAGAIEQYVSRGGQVLFFPPASVSGGLGGAAAPFFGVNWSGWVEGDPAQVIAVGNWRSDQDLLAVTRSGVGLPVGALEIRSYATLKGELLPLATLTGDEPLLARVPTDKGGVYFCTVSADSKSSTLASNGVVLYALIQRAIDQGLAALGNATMRVAGTIDQPGDDWRGVLVGHADEALSSQYPWQAGVYEAEEQLFAVNRAPEEDRDEALSDGQLEGLFEGLNFSRVNDRAGSMSGIVREIWRLFAVVMIAAMLIEAVLCMPRKQTQGNLRLAQSRTSSPLQAAAEARTFSQVQAP
ncbi:MAG: BatA domain-containing protein [Aureliella sp.]